ncbi:MAG: hypothetical protein U0W24_06135 [Bacteroidales bacterium]
MKRIFAILFSVIYLLLVTGISVSFHYCHGKQSSFSFTGNKTCCCETKEMSNNCCSNKKILIQFDSDQKLVNSFKINFSPDEIAVLAGILHLNLIKSNNNSIPFYFDDNSPPLIIPLWKLNCSYLFYS